MKNEFDSLSKDDLKQKINALEVKTQEDEKVAKIEGYNDIGNYYTSYLKDKNDIQKMEERLKEIEDRE